MGAPVCPQAQDGIPGVSSRRARCWEPPPKQIPTPEMTLGHSTLPALARRVGARSQGGQAQGRGRRGGRGGLTPPAEAGLPPSPESTLPPASVDRRFTPPAKSGNTEVFLIILVLAKGAGRAHQSREIKKVPVLLVLQRRRGRAF